MISEKGDFIMNKENGIWNGREVSFEEYWRLRLIEVSENISEENLKNLMEDLEMEFEG